LTYLAIVIAFSAIAIVNVGLVVYVLARTKGRTPSTNDQIVGFLVAGPLYFLIERGLRKRDHKLTAFEYYGLLGVALAVLLIVVTAIATGFHKYPA
jgi:hypothetical protein